MTEKLYELKWFFRGFYRSRFQSWLRYRWCDLPLSQCPDYAVGPDGSGWAHVHPRFGPVKHASLFATTAAWTCAIVLLIAYLLGFRA